MPVFLYAYNRVTGCAYKHNQLIITGARMIGMHVLIFDFGDIKYVTHVAHSQLAQRTYFIDFCP